MYILPKKEEKKGKEAEELITDVIWCLNCDIGSPTCDVSWMQGWIQHNSRLGKLTHAKNYQLKQHLLEKPCPKKEDATPFI